MQGLIVTPTCECSAPTLGIGRDDQEAFRIDHYRPISEPVSALEAGPNGCVQQVSLVAFGLLTIGYAVGLHVSVRPTRAGIVGPGLLLVSGIGLMLGAVSRYEKTQRESPTTQEGTSLASSRFS